MVSEDSGAYGAAGLTQEVDLSGITSKGGDVPLDKVERGPMSCRCQLAYLPVSWSVKSG